MRWILDSNVWIEGVAGVASSTNALLKAGSIDWYGFSSISRLEVLGFPKLTPEDEQRFRQLLAQFHQVPVSTEVIDAAIVLRRQIKIKTPDAIVAATALVEKADLVTLNFSDFQKIPGLSVINPSSL